MAYRITFTPRFQKHFKDLTAQEKKLLKNKLELLAENPAIRRCEQSESRGRRTFSSAASTWTSVSSGITKATR